MYATKTNDGYETPDVSTGMASDIVINDTHTNRYQVHEGSGFTLQTASSIWKESFLCCSALLCFIFIQILVKHNIIFVNENWGILNEALWR